MERSRANRSQFIDTSVALHIRVRWRSVSFCPNMPYWIAMNAFKTSHQPCEPVSGAESLSQDGSQATLKLVKVQQVSTGMVLLQCEPMRKEEQL